MLTVIIIIIFCLNIGPADAGPAGPAPTPLQIQETLGAYFHQLHSEFIGRHINMQRQLQLRNKAIGPSTISLKVYNYLN